MHLNQPFPVKNLYLRGYNVHGVPTVGGLPTYTFMNMIFHGGPQTTLYLRSDNQPGIPISLDDTYTSHHFSRPMLLSDQETKLFSWIHQSKRFTCLLYWHLFVVCLWESLSTSCLWAEVILFLINLHNNCTIVSTSNLPANPEYNYNN